MKVFNQKECFASNKFREYSSIKVCTKWANYELSIIEKSNSGNICYSSYIKNVNTRKAKKKIKYVF